jgi:long-chain acyl-CoA synthetase
MLTCSDYLSPEHVPYYKTVHEMIQAVCARHGAKVAMRMRGDDGAYREYSFGDVGEMSDGIARFLRARGMAPGDRVALMGENGPEWGIAYFGIVKAGAVVVPVDATLSFPDSRFVVEHSGATVLVASKTVYDRVWRDGISSLPAVKTVVLLDGTDGSVIPLDRCIAEGSRSGGVLPANFSPADPLAILYTSGTTGNPKAVMLTHGNVASNINGIHRMIHFDESDIFLSVLPIHHVFECTVGFLAALSAGCSITYAESLKSSSLIANMRETGVTLLLGVPLLFEKLYYGIVRAVEKKPLPVRLLFHSMLAVVRIARALLGLRLGNRLFAGLRRKAGLEGLRLLVSGGGPLPWIVARGFVDLGFTIVQGYGLSETSPVLTVSTLAHNNIHSAGLPLPDAEIRILDPGADGIGEIAARGPMVMTGYYRNPDATTAMFKDGWFLTGDSGYIDAEGFVHIVTHGGKNVHPEELEEKLDASPFIRESMVYGEPVSEEIKGEEVRAIIVPDYALGRENWENLRHAHSHHEPTDEAIEAEVARAVQHLNAHMPTYKKITAYRIEKEELVKTSTRKIKRYMYKSGSAAKPSQE